MLIETRRLYLRPVRLTDEAALYQLHCDPLVVRLTSNGTAMTRDQSNARLALYLREWQDYGFGFFIVYEKKIGGDLGFVGRCGLRNLDGESVEIGYCFNTQASGKGLATEAAGQMVHLAFSKFGIEELVGLVRPANTQSIRVLEKLGFHCTGMAFHRCVEYRRYELQARLNENRISLDYTVYPKA